MEIAERISPNTPEWIQGAGEHLSRYRFACQYVRGKRVLDVGCGVGYGSYMMAEAGADFVLGVDIDRNCIQTAHSHFKRDNAEFCVDNAQILDGARNYMPFDVIVSFENIEHLENPESFMQKSVQLLNKNGQLIVSTPDPRYSRKDENGQLLNKFHISEMSLEQFIQLISKYYENYQIYYQILSLEGLRAKRAQAIINHFGSSKTLKFENILRRLFKKAPFQIDLNINAESDFEIVSKPFLDTVIYAFIAIAEKKIDKK